MSIPRKTVTKTVRQYGPNRTETTITTISSNAPQRPTSRIPQSTSRIPLPKSVSQESSRGPIPSRIPTDRKTMQLPRPAPVYTGRPQTQTVQQRVQVPSSQRRDRPQLSNVQTVQQRVQVPSSQRRDRPQLSNVQNAFGGRARKTAPPPFPSKQRIPTVQVYQAPETSTGAFSKASVKTMKTQKVENVGPRKKTITKVTKTIKPLSSSESGGAAESVPTPGADIQEEVLPYDLSFERASPTTSIEKLVEKELMRNVSMSPGTRARAKGSKRTETRAPILQTPDGEVQGSIQISLNRQVERTPEVEYIKRYMTGVEVDDEGVAKKYEYSIQDMEPSVGIPRRSDGVVPLHEVISVKSTVSFAPGVKIRENTTVYQSVEPDPEQISQMIDEEARDVEKVRHVRPPDLKGSVSNVYGLKKRLQKMQLEPENVRQLETTIEYPPISADEAPAEVQPELMAAIMHTEEKGLSLESPPSNVYNYLYPDIQDDLTIKVKPVAPRPMQKVVVPENIPFSMLSETVPPEVEYLATTTKDSSRPSPTDDIFSRSVLRGNVQPKINNTAVRGQPGRPGYPILSAEEPPWSVEELQPIMDLAGAAPSSNVQPLTALDISDTTPVFYHNENENVLEYHLIPQPPKYTSNVQLRGSQKPSWFPGFYIALPNNIRVLTTPCDVLPAAWQAVQPDIFSDDSFLIVG
ncbi:hypothetical protein RI129_005792 [Pyrocoelia pectoralis]|uniref:Uncharacterized protein n=1 Tax=Pyrocoelia pectoralis TaxID=417401 RepID=A0AAN7ZHR7_9COLE